MGRWVGHVRQWRMAKQKLKPKKTCDLKPPRTPIPRLLFAAFLSIPQPAENHTYAVLCVIHSLC